MYRGVEKELERLASEMIPITNADCWRKKQIKKMGQFTIVNNMIKNMKLLDAGYVVRIREKEEQL